MQFQERQKSGYHIPFGATLYEDGTLFSFTSRSATGARLLLYDDPNDVPSSVSVPPECAYIKLSPYDLSDLGLINDDGSIPSIIALSEKAFEPFVENPTGIDKRVVREHNLGSMKVYTLSGMQVRATNQPGIFIVNGKKVVNVGNQNQ